MAIEKLSEFAKDGQKNTDDLNLTDGFPVSKKPARQWFNWLFNSLTLKINEIIDDKFSKSGGTLSGKLTTRPSVLALTLDDLGVGNNAPLQTPHLHVPENTTAYIPFVHGSMQTTYDGYVTQISIGGYRGSNTCLLYTSPSPRD